MRERLLAWLDSRTGYRRLLAHVLDEPLPPGTGWAFTTGSVLTLLIGVQLATGVVLAMYYVPAPSLAYDSVRYIMESLPLGWLLRGLHVWGASFVVVAAVVHMLRVFLLGSYKAPREVTWMTGVVLLLLVLGFSLSGYLLPWDQKAYWATTVTINVARSAPLIGDAQAAVLRGGQELGALTLGRWYAAHVFLLPAALIVFIVAHVLLMRKHGISGPITPQAGDPIPFFPWHVLKDTVLMATAFVALMAAATLLPAHLDEIANPADSSYVPRPEWYFLSLFELLKYFPGPLEPVATLVIPGGIVLTLLALPFIDRGAERHPLRGGRRVVTLGMLLLIGGITALTVAGLRDMPVRYDKDRWGPLSVAGLTLASGETSSCTRCHVTGGPASPVESTRTTRDEEWLLYHMADPVAIAPGARPAGETPAPVLARPQAQAVLAYLRRLRAGAVAPTVAPRVREASATFAAECATCHMIDGEGGTSAPDLSQIGARRDAAQIAAIVTDPTGEFPDTMMPSFGERLGPERMRAMADYLAGRR